MSAIRKNELDGLARIVRHGKGMDFEVPDPEWLVTVDDFHSRQFAAHMGNRSECAMSHPDRQEVASGQLECASEMVAVFVREEDAGQVSRGQAEPFKLIDGLARTEPAIQEDASGSRFDEQRVAATAAAQRSKAHYFNWS
jgi:hypothetical protein